MENPRAGGPYHAELWLKEHHRIRSIQQELKKLGRRARAEWRDAVLQDLAECRRRKDEDGAQ
eukprot:6375679-Lingulodinium_polyedra.AAC.1